MDLGITGRVAVVTGGGRGIGLAAAALLLAEGVRVVLTDADGTALDAAVAGLRPAGEVVGMAADLVDVAHAQVLERRVAQDFGQAEILVHAPASDVTTAAFDQLTDDDWRRALDADLLCGVRLLRAFLPHMRRARWGRVVLVGAHTATRPTPAALPHGAAKAALLNLAAGLAESLGPEGILVHAVSPPTDRAQSDDAAAAAAVFLCSERARLAWGGELRVA